MYNLTNLTSADGIGDVASYANEVTGGAFWAMVVFALFIIMIMGLLRKGFEITNVVLASSFACLLVSAILYYGSFVWAVVPFVFLAIMALTGLYKMTTDPDG